MSRRPLVLVLLGFLIAAAALAGGAVAGKGKGKGKTVQDAIGLRGGRPHPGGPRHAGIPKPIPDITNADIQFSVNDGDLKAGNGTSGNPPSSNCDDALYERALGWLNSLEQPAMFTPGDNDWTDCDRPSNGGFNSLERLDHARQLFFSTPN